MKRIKYWLLCWLLGDICGRSECSRCVHYDSDGTTAYECGQGRVYRQARKAWGIADA